MVRVLASSLVAAVDSLTRVPAVSLTIEDHVLHYAASQSPGGAEAWHDACLAGDMSLVRVQVTRSVSGFTGDFQVQRITDPTQAAQWRAWTTLPGAGGLMFQDGSCAVSRSAGTLRAFAQQGSGGNELWAWTSTDDGRSWSGPISVVTPPAGALVRGIASAGNDDVFFLYDVAGGDALGCSFYSGGAWSPLLTWSLPAITSGAGLAAAFAGSQYTLIYSDGYTLASCGFHPTSGIWNAGSLIVSADTSAIGRISPRLTLDDGLYTLACVEYDTGTLTGSVYSYPRLRQSVDLQHWSDGRILHDFAATYGVVALSWPSPPAGSAGARTYVMSPGTIYSAPIFQASKATMAVDVSASILSYTRQEEVGKPARLEVVLDNSQGIYNSLVTPVTATDNYQPIGLNASLVLSEGYRTGTLPSTPGMVKVGTYHLARIQFVRAPEASYLRLLALDLSRNLDLVARYQQNYTYQTLSYLIAEVVTSAGLFALELPTTAQMSQPVPSFVLRAGQTYRHALDELCDIYGLVYFLDQDEVLQVRELSSGDAPVWTYQPEIESVSFGDSDERANHIIVSGKPPVGTVPGALTTAEAFDDAQMRLIGLERLVHHVDPRLITPAQCALKASFLLAQEVRAQVAHNVTVPLNPALQLFDGLILVDSVIPGSRGQNASCRVRALRAHYDAQRGIDELSIACEGL